MKYASTRKNIARDNVINEIMLLPKKRKQILCLESPGYFFVDRLPNDIFTIIEKDEITYNKLCKKKRSNVKEILFSTIEIFLYKNEIKYDIIYFDYCHSLLGMIQDNIFNYLCKEKSEIFKDTSILAFTFTMRNYASVNKDYNDDIHKHFKEWFPYHNVKFIHPYYGSSPMVSILLLNKKYKYEEK